MARVEMTDVVIDKSGKPRPNITVAITAVAAPATQNMWKKATGSEVYAPVKTNANGVWSLFLDEGEYAVTPSGGETHHIQVIKESSVTGGDFITLEQELKELKEAFEGHEVEKEKEVEKEVEDTKGTNLPFLVPSVGAVPVELRTKAGRVYLKGAIFNFSPDRISHSNEAIVQWEKRKEILEKAKSIGVNTVCERVLIFEWEKLEFNHGTAKAKTKAAYIEEQVKVAMTGRELGMYTCFKPWDATDSPTWEGAKFKESGNFANAFWAELIAAIKAVEGLEEWVILDLMNEPHELEWKNWTPMAEQYQTFIRGQGWTNLICIEPIDYSNSGPTNGVTVLEGFNPTQFRKLMAKDASLPGMNGKSQILIGKHDYYFDSKIPWNQAEWENVVWGPEKNIDIPIWQNEIGYFVNAGIAESSELNEEWAKKATNNAATFGSGHPWFVGFALYNWSWLDKNTLTKKHGESGEFVTLVEPWGGIGKVALEGSEKVEEKEKGGTEGVPGFVVGVDGGANWGAGPAKAMLAGGIKSTRVNMEPELEWELQKALEFGFVNIPVIIANTGNGTKYNELNLTTVVARAVQEVEKIKVQKEAFPNAWPATGGKVPCIVVNEPYYKGVEGKESTYVQKEPAKYAELFVKLDAALVAAGIRSSVLLLFETFGDYQLSNGGAFSKVAEGKGWNKACFEAQPTLKTIVDDISFHPYGRPKENSENNHGPGAAIVLHTQLVGFAWTHTDFYMTEFGYEMPGSTVGNANVKPATEAEGQKWVSEVYTEWKGLGWVREAMYFTGHDLDGGAEKWGVFEGRVNPGNAEILRPIAHTIASFS